MPQSHNAKNRIVDKAARVFYQHGYRATGVETIAKAAGITKATLYHHFNNKDELIEETLRYLSEYHREHYCKAWNKKGLTPLAKLMVLFDKMDVFFKEPEFYGCPFINAAAEYTDKNSAVRAICEEHYAFLITHLEAFAHDAGLIKPRQLAEQLAGCIAGAYCTSFVAGLKSAAKQGKKTAELLIAAHKKMP